jgi:hypothetical protein
MNARRHLGWLLDPEVRRLREDAALNAAELARTSRALTIVITERAEIQREHDRVVTELNAARLNLITEEELHARARQQRDMAIGERDVLKRHRDAAWSRLRALGEAIIDDERATRA